MKKRRSAAPITYMAVADEELGKFLLQLNIVGAETSLRSFQGFKDNGRPNFHKKNLQGKDFTGAGLTEVNFNDTQLQEAKFIKTTLHQARFQWANLYKAKFCGAYTWCANFKGANLIGADLTGTFLSFAVLDGAVLIGVEGCSKEDLDFYATKGAITTPEALLDAVKTGKILYKRAYGYTKSLLDLAGTEENPELRDKYRYTANACMEVLYNYPLQLMPIKIKQDILRKPVLMLLGGRSDSQSYFHILPDDVTRLMIGFFLQVTNLWGTCYSKIKMEANRTLQNLRHVFNAYGAGQEWPMIDDKSRNPFELITSNILEIRGYKACWSKTITEEKEAFPTREKVQLLLMARNFDPGSSLYLTSDIGAAVYYTVPNDQFGRESGVRTISRVLIEENGAGNYWRNAVKAKPSQAQQGKGYSHLT